MRSVHFMSLNMITKPADQGAVLCEEPLNHVTLRSLTKKTKTMRLLSLAESGYFVSGHVTSNVQVCCGVIGN